MIAHKYRAIPTEVDGYRFPSKKQAKRYAELKILEKQGLISNLMLEVPYPVAIAGKPICKYVADFVYEDHGKQIVEDTKGYRTREYRLKKKLVEALYNLEIIET